MVQIVAEKGANTPFLPSVRKCYVKAHCNDHETTVPKTIVIYLKPPWKEDEQMSHVRRTNDVCG